MKYPGKWKKWAQRLGRLALTAAGLVLLFQLLFLLAPAAGTKIFNDSQAGEYFRTVISNGVIAVSLVLHAVNKVRLMKAEKARA